MNQLLLTNEIRVPIGDKRLILLPPHPPVPRAPSKLGFGLKRIPRSESQAGRSVSSISSEEEVKMRDVLASGTSHESEHDLAILVSEFLEDGSSGTEYSWYSSDSESGLSDLQHLVERIMFWKQNVEQHESDLLATVHSRIVSMKESEIQAVNGGQCSASCIRRSLVNLLRVSGLDAALCTSKWQGDRKYPGGDHEYIDVVTVNPADGACERLIVEMDFRSHFEIARAVESYETVLSYLPVVYVGSLSRLDQFLQIMVEATKWSLKQNSMSFPPWRALPYLQAKWHSIFERESNVSESSSNGEPNRSMDHDQCIEYFKRLKMSLWSEIDMVHYFKNTKPGDKKCDKKHRLKFGRRQRPPSLLRS